MVEKIKWESIDIEKEIFFETGLSLIKINIYDKDYLFLVDTGANDCIIDTDAVKELGPNIELVETDNMLKGFESNMQLKEVNIPVKVANIDETMLFSVLSLDNINEYFNEKNGVITGIIGSNFLRYFALIIDFHQLKLWYPVKYMEEEDL